MIQLIEKIIIEKFLDLTGGINVKLSFLKYSTPNSGKSLDDKVIFFVFKANEKNPFLCVKTVRTYLAKNTVIKNFDNLKKLNDLTNNSKYENMFAKALYLFDDGENIFSIETVCPGIKTKLNKKRLEIVTKKYIDFQEYLARNNNGQFITDIEQFVKDIIIQSELKESDKKKILQFIGQMSFKGIRLPRIIQHGDVTEDNILLEKDSVSIIDCDFVGFTDMPGFDLFGLFYRFDKYKSKKLCYEYFPEYFIKIRADIGVDKYDNLFFLYYFLEHLRKKYLLEKVSADEIISDFKIIYKM